MTRALARVFARIGPWVVLAWLLTGAAAVRAAPAPGPLSLAFGDLDTATPSTLCPGERRWVTVRLRNVGTQAWSPAQRDFVAYHWLDAEGNVVQRDGERSPLPGRVEPGRRVEVSARLFAPSQPGRYRLRWALVREGVQWVEGGDALDVEVVGRAPALAWSRVAGGVPGPLGGGQHVTVPLRVRNEGCAAWSPEQSDAIAYHWYDAEGRRVVREGERTPIPALAPGQSVEVAARVRAPTVPGSYALQWRPIREGLSWLPPSDRLVAVEVGAAARAWSVEILGVPSRLGAGDRVEVSAWLRNEGHEEWSHERGDAWSYRWYDEAGSLVAEGPRTSLPSPWVPGDDGIVDAPLVAPEQPGRYRLVWEIVRDGVAWYGPPASGEAESWVEVTAPRLSWAVVEAQMPGACWVHRRGAIRVVLRNTGTEAWSPRQGDRLSYRWLDPEDRPVLGDGQRTLLPHEVAPGDEVTLWARIRGPADPGRYTLELEMVREHVRWYGPPTLGVATVRVRVERWSSYWVVLLGVAGLGVAGILRWGSSPRSPEWRWLLWRSGAALWVGAATAVLVHCFADLSGVEPWHDARWVVVGPAGLVALALLPLPPRVQAWGGVLIVGLLSALALADLAYLHFFGSIVPLAAIAAVDHLVDAEATVSSLLRPAYGWLLALPGLALGVAGLWPGRGRGRVPAMAPAHARRGVVVVVISLLVLATPLVIALGRVFSSGRGQQVFSERDNVGRLGVVGAHLYAVLRGIDAWLGPKELSAARRRALVEAGERAQERRRRASARAPGFGAARGFDVVLIQVEALQDWVVGARVQGQAITPFLEAAMSEALYFDQVFDQTAQGRTSDAEYLVLGGGHPPDRGALAFLHADNDFYTLAHVLSDAGYHTQSGHPYARGFWNRAQLHPRYGFVESSFRRELGPGPQIGWGLTDAAFFERMTPRLLGAPSPSLSFLITLSLHHPYESFPEAFKRLRLGGLEGSAVGNYLHAMHHFDAALADLLDSLRRVGRLGRTLVVIYGDHVTGLGEPESVLALAGRPAWDPSVHAALHRVPVFVWVGEQDGGPLVGRRSTVGGQIDIGATVVHLLGIDDPRPMAWGRTLLDPDPGFAAFFGGSAVDPELLFVARGPGIGREGGCFERRAGRSVPLTRCESLRRRARAELDDARLVLAHDLARARGGEP